MRFLLVAGLGTLPVFLLLSLILDRGLGRLWPVRDRIAGDLAGGVPAGRRLMTRALVRVRPDPVPVLAVTLLLALVLGLGVDALHADDPGDPLGGTFDRVASAWMQDGRSAALDPLVIGLTSFGDAPVMIAATIALVGALGVQKAVRLAIGIAVTMLAARLLVAGLKPLIGIARPSSLYDGVEAFSFPSAHAAMTTTFAGILFLLVRPGSAGRTAIRAGLAFLVAAMIASRLYLGAHWPSDVVAGLGVGLAFATAFGFAYGPFPPAGRAIDRALLATLVVSLIFGCGRLAMQMADALGFYAPAA